MVWLLGLPILQLMVYLWMNTVIRGRVARGQYEFIVFLLVAMMPYRLFRDLWNQVTNGAASNQGLFGFRQVKPMDTFVARAVLEIAIESITFVLIAVGLVRMGYGPLLPVDVLAYILIVCVFCLLGVSLGICTAIGQDVFPRLGSVVSVVTMPLMILSGVIFPLHNLPSEMTYWLLMNPVLHLVELARVAYLPGYVMVQGVSLWFPLWFTLIVTALAMSLYRVRRRQLIAR